MCGDINNTLTHYTSYNDWLGSVMEKERRRGEREREREREIERVFVEKLFTIIATFNESNNYYAFV